MRRFRVWSAIAIVLSAAVPSHAFALSARSQAPTATQRAADGVTIDEAGVPQVLYLLDLRHRSGHRAVWRRGDDPRAVRGPRRAVGACRRGRCLHPGLHHGRVRVRVDWTCWPRASIRRMPSRNC